MSCRRICRELLWQARFGELGPGSAPHLEHLTDCRACRDELGFDRALVSQLRTALAARIEGAAPSPRVWEGIRARMAIPEPRPSRLRAWSTVLVARLRIGSAMAGASLAFLLALNVEVVPLHPLDPTPAAPGSVSVPARPLSLADGFPHVDAAVPYAGEASAPAEAAETAPPPTVVGIGVQEPEQLPILGARVDDALLESEEVATLANDAAPVVSQAERQPLTIRLVPSDAAVVRASTSAPAPEPEVSEEPPPAPTPVPSGAPS
jgi:hypothetical protein